jgi:amino acid adenylation domain-containing protein
VVQNTFRVLPDMSNPKIEISRLAPKTTSDVISSSPAQLRGPGIAHFAERPFPRLFEDQVAQEPDKTAVFCDRETLTFGELNARANQLARHLRSLGVGSESLVGICIDRSLEMAIGIIGILKAGGAYLPLDPEYPTERLAFMLADAQPMLVLTRSNLEKRLPRKFQSQDHPPLPLGEELGVRAYDTTDPHPNPPQKGEGNEPRTVLLDQDWPTISGESNANLSDRPSPDDLAYVIYTSGSTGRPKGAMITHRNLANYLLALNHELKLGRDDLYLHTASIAFSSSRRQLMLPLSQGAGVVIANSEERKDPLALFAMIKERRVTVMDAVPSFWRNCTTILASLDDEERESLLANQLRLILSASEPLLSDIPQMWIRRFQHPARHVHMFGQTETAGIVCLYHIPEQLDENLEIIPIGAPIANTEIYILDERRRLCDIGEAGELYIGGAGVGRGYLNRSELTAQKFIPHPFNQQSCARLYRTGDWARVREDGQIEFAGRRDQQVKLRGFRVELGEIEVALAKHPSVRESVVVARDDTGGDKKLIAYLVANGTAPNAGELRNFLSAQLPEYIVPAAFVVIDALPLSANGKVNRLALPDPDQMSARLSSEYLAPRNEIEHRLAAIWAKVLRVERVGVNDNFFELGGHSLLAAQVISRLRSELAIETPLRLLFEHPTVASLAATVKNLNEQADRALSCSIQPFERNGTAPLSFTQQQFWLLDQATPNRSTYNVRTAVKLTGALDVQKLRLVLETIVARHEILRTHIVTTNDSPIQAITPRQAITLEICDLGLVSAGDQEAEIARIHAAEAEVPFDLSQGPLTRFKLLKLSPAEHVLLITIHHIICDGWSIDLLHREIATLYASSGELPHLPIQYADFAIWQRRRLQGEILERQLDYWKRELADAPTALDLPIDYARPVIRNSDGHRLSLVLSESLSRALKSLSQREGATLFMTLLATFQALLFRYSGQEDIVVGSPVAGRTMLETENLIGAFVNTLVFRSNLAGNPTFREVLGRVRETVLGAFSHQELPFEKLVEELNPERKVNRSPLFQVMFALQNMPAPDLSVDGLSLTPLKLGAATSKFDLSLEVEEKPPGLCVSIEYATDLFAAATIERMLGHFQSLLEGAVNDPTQSVTDLSLMTEAESRQLLIDWNDNQIEVPDNACLHYLFEDQAAKTPNKIAAEFRGARLTYGELNARANQLAGYLRKQSVGPEVMVGVRVERSFEMLVAVFAVLKAGGAYVPLDPNYPNDRIAFMIADTALPIVITQKHLAKDIPGDAKLICIDADWETIAGESEENPTAPVSSSNVALVLYTSGSTGNPKGVMLEHHSLVNFITAGKSAYEIAADDRILQFGSLSFDLSAEEIFLALTCGGTIVLRTDEMISSAQDFLRLCEEWNLSVLDLPTVYWHELTDALSRENLTVPQSIRLVIIGGEKAATDRVVAWNEIVGDRVRLLNTYGPTETTIAVTICDLSSPKHHLNPTVTPIGRAMANTNLYVLDPTRRPVPIGIPGELHIGGPGVARGYLNLPDLTSEKFIANLFSDDPRARLYKTGDVVRYQADGNLEFLGRVDNQIKIRGFRVELEEIEQALRGHDQVDNCVVVLHEDDDKRLVAYVVLETESQASTSELRNFLKTKLPSYMVPAAFEVIDALPLMPSGKIDRRALPEPHFTRTEPDESFASPRTPLELVLADAWREVLKVDQIGLHENFFDLGGHSLLATRVVSNIRNVLNIELCMVDVFQAPTISGLAELLYPRIAQKESMSEFAALLEELANLSEAEALACLDRELRIDQVAA